MKKVLRSGDRCIAELAEIGMQSYLWNDSYFDGGWFLWFGLIVLLFFSMGYWRYACAAQRRYGLCVPIRKDARNLPDERYVRRDSLVQNLPR